MRLQNLHTHSTFCDGKDKPEDMLRTAMAKGLDSLGFSGHSSVPGYWVLPPDRLPSYRAEILRLKEAYKDRIPVFLGLEQDSLADPVDYKYDYLIGSVHSLVVDERILPLDHSPACFIKSARQGFGGDMIAMAEYFYQRVGEVVDVTGCSIVGHFDLITKFNEGDRLFDTGDPRYIEAALSALDRLAPTGVICEINTGAMAKGWRTAPYPSVPILQAMHERHIPICINSDCHNRDFLTCGFELARKLAWDCGYREVMYFNGKEFEPEPLDPQ